MWVGWSASRQDHHLLFRRREAARRVREVRRPDRGPTTEGRIAMLTNSPLTKIGPITQFDGSPPPYLAPEARPSHLADDRPQYDRWSTSSVVDHRDPGSHFFEVSP